MTGKLKDLTLNRDGTQNVTITVNADFREEFDRLAEKEVTIDIKRYAKHRSMDANNFFWHLCSEIAKRSSKFSTDSKDDVYREAIRAKGVFEPLMIRQDALERFMNRWCEKGTGWFADVVDDYKERYKIVHAYYGSSTYSSAEMSAIIDYVVIRAEELGIPTITDKELQKLLGRWQEKQDKKAAG